jgi:saccharopine dehydrogenase-like NADP-dependent oxidoreductase
MRVLIVGSGAVGGGIAVGAARSDAFEAVTVTDLDAARARAVVDRVADPRFGAAALDASDRVAITECARHHRADVIVNACDPRLNPPIFGAAFDAACTYLDMAMTLSEPHPDAPWARPGVMLGAAQFAAHDAWHARGLLAVVGMGVEPGLSTSSPGSPLITCSRRYASSVCATAATSWSTASRLHRRSPSGRRSRSA